MGVFCSAIQKLSGEEMEHQIAETGHVVGGAFASAGARNGLSPSRGGRGLTLELSTLCADVRHHEDRAPDSGVIAGGAGKDDVWFIRSGILRLQRYGYDGRRQIMSLFLPGEIIGCAGEFREGVNVEAVTHSRLCRIDRRKFEIVLNKSSELRAGLFHQKLDQLDRLRWLTWSLGALTPEQRLCAFLALSTRFMPCDPLPDGTTILSMQLPRVDIADLLGTSVETICRINRKLADSGVIKLEDSSHFRILDLEKMKALGQITENFDRMVRGTVMRGSRPGSLAGHSCRPGCFCGL